MKKIFISVILVAAMLVCPESAVFAAENTNESISVEPVDFPATDVNGGRFIKGVDVSSYFSLKDSGVVYRDFDGNALDDNEYFAFLKLCGVNYIRVRIWNDPYDDSGRGYGGGNCDLNNAIKIGKLATDSGMKLLADFHLSDFWADPSEQRAPKAWSGYSMTEKETAVYDFVYDSLTELKNAGIDVGMVQTGNEINTGLCGETSQSSIARLVKSGANAVSDFDKSILKAVHYTNPESNDYRWFAENLKQYGVDYDVFASSYYPYWHGSPENFTSKLKEVADTYGKYVMCAETSYPFTSEDSDFHGNSISGSEDSLEYPVSVQGQASALRDVFESVANVGSKGIGVFYWEPAWITVGTSSYYDNLEKWEAFGSGWESSYAANYCSDGAKYHGGSSWDNQAMFDSGGNPLPSLMTFKLVSGGAEDPTQPATAASTADGSLICGDVNGDGTVSILDATQVQKHLAGMVTFTSEQATVADTDRDGRISVKDATQIQKYVAGIITDF